MSKEVILTGHTGLVGSTLKEHFKDQGYQITTLGRNQSLSTHQIDLTDARRTEEIISTNQAPTVVHFAEYLPSVDALEEGRLLGHNSEGYKINVGMVKLLASLCEKYSKRLVFASTSYVFDGTSGPYSEEDVPPSNLTETLSFYGYIKRHEELAASDNCNMWTSVRFEMPFRGDNFPKVDFVRKILSLYKEGKIRSMFSDQTITPVYIKYLAKAVEQIIEAGVLGYTHVGSSDITSPHKFTIELLKACGIKNPEVKEDLFENYQKPTDRAPRPHKGGIFSETTRQKLGTEPMTSSQMIEAVTRELQLNGITS